MNIQVLKGSLLGDMWIQPRENKKNSFNYTIRFEQSEFDYALWKAKMCGVPFTLTTRKRYDKRTNKDYYSYFVHLTVNKKLKHNLYNSFYNPVKIVSDELLNSLTPLALTIWYLDDGNIYYNGNNCHLTLAVNGFDLESKNRIIDYFKINYELNFKHTGKAIRLTSRKDVENFMLIVEKFIPKCMKRKIFKYQFKKYDKTLSDEQRKYRNNKYK